MRGNHLRTTMMFNSKKTKEAFKSVFGFSEVQNRIALNTIKMIVGDMVTLYLEFKKTEGAGALFFVPSDPSSSRYVPIQDIKRDIILSEELMDNNLTGFLKKLENIVAKHDDDSKPIVVLVTGESMSIHIVNPDEVSDNINDYLTDASS